MTHYPETPGYKDQTTSKEAAFALLKGKKPTRHKVLRTVVLELYQAGFEGTADDAGERLGISPFSCRPRITELYKAGKLERVRIVKKRGTGRWIMRLARAPAPEPITAAVQAIADQLTMLLDDDGQPDEQQEWHDYDPDC